MHRDAPDRPARRRAGHRQDAARAPASPRELLADGALVLLGRCWEDPLAPFEPYAEALRQADADAALRPGDRTPPARATACSTPSTPRWPGSPRALRCCSCSTTCTGPTAARCCSRASCCARSAPGPLLVLGTYRDTELGRNTPADRRARGPAARRRARPRRAARARRGRRRRARPRRCSATTRSPPRVHARTAGNAFFVEEVLRGLAERAPRCPRACATRSACGSSGSATTPTSCSPPPRCSDSNATPRALAATAGLEPAAAETRPRRAPARAAAAPGGDRARFEFAHALVREAVYDELNVLRRARLHRRAAEALTRAGEDRHLEEIATHLFEAAGTADARRAADSSRAPGAARSTGSPTRTPPSASPARSRRSSSPARRTRPGRSCSRAATRCCAPASPPRPARRSRARARSRAGARDTALLAQAALGFAGLGIAIVDLDAQAIARLEEALELASDPRAALAPAGPARGRALLRAGPRALGGAQRRGGRDARRASGDPSALAAALDARHVALWRPDRARRAARGGRRDDRGRARAGDRPPSCRRATGACWTSSSSATCPRGAPRSRRHAGSPTSCACPTFQWYTPLWAAVDAMLAGRFDEAERLRARGRREAGGRAGDRNAELFAAMVEVHRAARARRVPRERPRVRRGQDRQLAGRPGLPRRRSPGCSPSSARRDEAREQLAAPGPGGLAFDANWMSAIGECAEAAVRPRATPSTPRRLRPAHSYAGRPAHRGPRRRLATASLDRLPRRARRAARPHARRRAPPARRDRAQRGDGRHRLGPAQPPGAAAAAARPGSGGGDRATRTRSGSPERLRTSRTPTRAKGSAR